MAWEIAEDRPGVHRARAHNNGAAQWFGLWGNAPRSECLYGVGF